MRSEEKIESISVIGLGNFGKFAASLVPEHAGVEVMGHDIREVKVAEYIKKVDLGRAALADVIVLAVPLDKYEAVLEPLSSLITSNSLLIDVCSVKREPGRIIRKYLPDHPHILLTHPFFGPRSASDGVKGHTLAVTYKKGARAERVLEECQNLGLKVEMMSPSRHDMKMMRMHVLTTFIALALEKMGINDEDGADLIPSYQMLLDLSGFAKGSSPDLLRTIQLGNPYAPEARQEFIKVLQAIEAEFSDPGQSDSVRPYRSYPRGFEE